VVLVALDEAFEGRDGVASLSACRHRVERMVSGRRPEGQHRESSSALDVSSLLDALVEGIESLKTPNAGVLALALERARELRAFLGVSGRPNWNYVERKLLELDKEIDGSVLGALDPAMHEELFRQAERVTERHRGRVSDEALQEAAQRSLVQRARERLGLPRSLGV
jgi:hypothetical protein